MSFTDILHNFFSLEKSFFFGQTDQFEGIITGNLGQGNVVYGIITYI